MADKLSQAGAISKLVVDAFGEVAKITDNTVDDKAVAGLKAIAQIVDLVRRGAEGRISIEACELALSEMRATEADTNRTIDAIIARRRAEETKDD